MKVELHIYELEEPKKLTLVEAVDRIYTMDTWIGSRTEESEKLLDAVYDEYAKSIDHTLRANCELREVVDMFQDYYKIQTIPKKWISSQILVNVLKETMTDKIFSTNLFYFDLSDKNKPVLKAMLKDEENKIGREDHYIIKRDRAGRLRFSPMKLEEYYRKKYHKYPGKLFRYLNFDCDSKSIYLTK